MPDDDTKCLLSATAQEYPDCEAIRSANRSLSFSELDRRVEAAAAELHQQGVRKGDRVALIGPNSIDTVVVILAVIRAGCIVAPISHRFPQKTVATVMRTVGVTWLLTNYAEYGDALNEVRVLPYDQVTNRTEPPEESRPHVVGFKQDATIVLTSGSTAIPKAALLTYGNHYYNALGSNENISLQPGDRWLLSLPLYHVGGLGILFRCLLGGATLVVPERHLSLAETIKQDKITHLSLVPTQLSKLLDNNPAPDASSHLKAVLVGGGPIPGGLVKRATEAGLPIYTTYGLTEMASQVATAGSPGSGESSGQLLNYRDLKIADNGEILVKGPCLFLGYIRDGQVDPAVDDSGWFHTGDIGRVDEHHGLHVIGRLDNMFISGGENIHPEEIEGVLGCVPGVTQSLVVAVNDATFGQRPVAFVRFDPSIVLNARDIMTTLSEQLPRFKIPVAFYEWPDDLSGDQLKPSRRQATELAADLIRRSR